MKITALQNWLKQEKIDICFINNPANIAYLTGYISNPHERIIALIVSAERGSFFFVPALEVLEAKKAITDYPVIGYQDTESPWDIIKTQVATKMKNHSQWAIEKNFLTVERFAALLSTFPNSDFNLDITEKIQDMMLIKSEDELAKMKVAGKWADFALKVGCESLEEGISETEVVAIIEYELKKQGIQQMSFDTTVLFGDHAASPHGTPGERTLKQGELVLFDLGCVYEGYTSDVTRTFAFGEVSEKVRLVYDVVLKAQLAAQNAVRPGITAEELDKIARDVIIDSGFGEYFIHRLGHGLGSAVHEYPSIIAGNKMILEQGMCFSIEPGIYIPDVVGVRIEDCVYVTETGCATFTNTSKEWGIL